MEAMSSHEKEDETSAPAGVKLKKNTPNVQHLAKPQYSRTFLDSELLVMAT